MLHLISFCIDFVHREFSICIRLTLWCIDSHEQLIFIYDNGENPNKPYNCHVYSQVPLISISRIGSVKKNRGLQILHLEYIQTNCVVRWPIQIIRQFPLHFFHVQKRSLEYEFISIIFFVLIRILLLLGFFSPYFKSFIYVVRKPTEKTRIIMRCYTECSRGMHERDRKRKIDNKKQTKTHIHHSPAHRIYFCGTCTTIKSCKCKRKSTQHSSSKSIGENMTNFLFIR